MAENRKSEYRSYRGRRPRRRVCTFCDNKEEKIDYKNTTVLKRFIAESGKILPRRMSGCCAGHQRAVSVAIKRARQVALLSYTDNK